jgi:hypothetical protein
MPLLSGLGIAALLSGILAVFQDGNGWRGALAFFVVLAPGWLILEHLSASEKSALLRRLILASFLLRLALGLGLYLGLSLYGYPNEQERAGYLFTDAYRRDQQAWELAQSNRPLTDAFQQRFYADQYGGLLALSAALYRFLSPDAHRPLLIVGLGAWIGALGIYFFWKSAQKLLSPAAARNATWLFAFYPEMLLLSASQMREPFLITFGTMLLFALLQYQEKKRISARILAGSLAGLLLISPGTALAFGIALGFWLWLESGRYLSLRVWLIVGLMTLLGMFLFSLSVAGISVEKGHVLEVLGEWSRLAVRWSAYQLERSSGWVQKLFRETPPAFQIPFIIGYGYLQPVLPGAFIEPSIPIRKAISILRATAWYALLPLLIFAFRAVWKAPATERKRWLAFLVITWVWMTIASLRGGGDQWDTPRYRLFFLTFQAMLAAYAWERRDVWWPRLLWIEGFSLAIFFQWYLSRYYHIGGRLPFFTMIGIIFAFAILIISGSLLWDRMRKKAGWERDDGR